MRVGRADNSQIAGILFDKDGTLLSFNESWGPVNRKVALFASAGDPVLADNLLYACGMDPVTGQIVPDSLLAVANTAEIAAGFVAAGSPVAIEVLVPQIDNLFAEASDISVPVTDLVALFSRLKAAGLKLGIASSDNERSIRNIVSRFGIDDFVDYVAGYDSGHGAKPGAGMVIGFCRQTGLEPAMVAVVGDSNHDMHMGLNAGVGLTVAVLGGTGSRESLEAAADHCLKDVTELADLLGLRAPA